MKKYTRIFIIWVLSLITNNLFAQETQIIDGFKYFLNDIEKEAILMPNDYNQEKINIPANVIFNEENYSVTGIGIECFSNCKNLKEITFPSTLTTIAKGAFYGCSNLNQIVLSNKISKIEDNAFAGTGITNINIPGSVKTISYNLFGGCKKLQTVTIEEGINSIESCAFDGCSNLETINIPTTVKSIERLAFRYCYKLKTVLIDDIASWCNISFGEGSSNDSCTPLFYTHSLYLKGKLLEHLVIPSSVQIIKSRAFFSCKSLKSVEIPTSVREIGDAAFESIDSLSVYIKDLESWSKIKIGSWGNPLVDFGNLYVNNELVTELDIPASLTQIDNRNFDGCSSFKELIIHKNVTKILGGAFSRCTNISSIKCYCKNPPKTTEAITSNNTACILYVPKESINLYKNDKYWGVYKYIYSLEGEVPSEKQQCESPRILFESNNVVFTSNTPNVKYNYSIICKDSQRDVASDNGIIPITGVYEISVYATADGYKPSDKVTATLYWINANLETTGINQAKTRGVVASCHDGFISISGLENNETVRFFSTDGKLIGSQQAINGEIQYAIDSSTPFVIAKIKNSSIKIAIQ